MVERARLERASAEQETGPPREAYALFDRAGTSRMPDDALL